jgi:hypothetical protein
MEEIGIVELTHLVEAVVLVLQAVILEKVEMENKIL